MGEVILTSSQLRNTADEDSARAADLSEGFDRMDRVVGEMQRRVLDLRTTPLLRAMDALPRLARDLALRCHKRVEVTLRGAELELDRAILDRMTDPLVHLVRNAVDHGVESPEVRNAAGKPELATILVHARRERDFIRIEVRDDGSGIDLEAVRERAVERGLVHPDLAEDLPPDEVAQLIFSPGLSTAASVSEVSGRGVGMDAVRSTLESLGGYVEVETRAGEFTATCLVVPIAAAVQRVLLLGVGIETVALPIARVERIFEVPASEIEDSGQESFTLIGSDPYLVLELSSILGIAPGPESATACLAMAELRGQLVALRVDRFVGQQEIYVKPVPELLAGVRALAGLTILADGQPVFVVDLNQLA